MKRVYMNIDVNTTTVPFLNQVARQKTVTREMLYPYVDIYRNTAVTDILFNIFGQSSVCESKYWDSYADIYERKEENGIPVDYSVSNGYDEPGYDGSLYGVHRINREFGIDPWKVWVKRARENGHRAWISLRMNDSHLFKLETCWIRSLFYYEAKARGMTLGDEYLYYKGAYDYEYDEIRERMLGYIEEQLLAFDADGLELDFSREIQLFKYLTADMDKCRKIMTEFIRNIKRIVERCEKVHGHKILLGIKCMRDFINNSFYGLDILEIAREGLIDIVFPGPRFRRSETGVPVDEWRRAMPNVEVVPTLETALAVINNKYREITREVARGVVANYLTYNPSGIYYYNYFIGPQFYTDGILGNQWLPEWVTYNTRGFDLISCPLEYSAIHKSAVRFVLIPQEIEGYAKLAPVWMPIPAPLTKEGATFELRTGPIPEGKKLTLILGFKNYTGRAKVTVNGVECSEFSETSLDFIEGIGYQTTGYVEEDTVCYKCSLDGVPMDGLIQKITVSGEDSREILDWVEISCY